MNKLLLFLLVGLFFSCPTFLSAQDGDECANCLLMAQRWNFYGYAKSLGIQESNAPMKPACDSERDLYDTYGPAIAQYCIGGLEGVAFKTKCPIDDEGTSTIPDGEPNFPFIDFMDINQILAVCGDCSVDPPAATTSNYSICRGEDIPEFAVTPPPACPFYDGLGDTLVHAIAGDLLDVASNIACSGGTAGRIGRVYPIEVGASGTYTFEYGFMNFSAETLLMLYTAPPDLSDCSINLLASSGTTSAPDTNASGLLSVTLHPGTCYYIAIYEQTSAIGEDYNIVGTGAGSISACSTATADVTWWDAPTGGTQVGTGATFNPTGQIGEEGTMVVPNTPGTYTFYAGSSCFYCDSATRTQITLTIRTHIIDGSSLVITDPAAVCATNTVDLTDAAITAGSIAGTFSYYTDANKTMPISDPTMIASSGTYYIELEDGNACTIVKPVNVTIYPQTMIININSANESCTGANDAYLTVAATTLPSGSPLEYAVGGSNYQTSPNFTNLSPGTYIVSARVNAICPASQSLITITASTEACDLCSSLSSNPLDMQKVVAADRTSSRFFGSAVAISGTYAIVGGHTDLFNSGDAYIFEQDANGTWLQAQKLSPSNTSSSTNSYGRAVSISGNYAIVGARYEDLDASGSNAISRAGAAYIFERDAGGTWTEVQKIVANDRATFEQFGASVSISGNYVLVGARNDGNSGGLDGKGAAYIFERDAGGTWTEIQKLKASDGAAGDIFGESVAIDGNYATVGAYQEDENASGGASLTDAGAAYVFERNTSGTWTEVQKLVASDRSVQANFAGSVSISGNYTIVGARNEDLDATGSNFLTAAGAAYLYERDAGGTWTEMQKLVASDRASNDIFGGSVSLSGNRLLVGATQEDEDNNGSNTLSESGAAYLFTLTGGTWVETQKIVAPDRADFDLFGNVAISGSNVMIGAYWEDEDSNGNNTVSEAGSVYLLNISCLVVITDIIVVDEQACEGGTITVNAQGATNIEYSIDDGMTYQSSNVFTNVPAGTYNVKIRDANDIFCADICVATVAPSGVPCPIKLSPKVLLQGPFAHDGTATMTDTLRQNNLIPLTEPYMALGYAYTGGGGGETTTTATLAITGSKAIVDWVVVELRDATTPTTIVESRAALVCADGSVVDMDGTSAVIFNTATGNSYYVAIRHRNHLAVMTGNPISF